MTVVASLSQRDPRQYPLGCFFVHERACFGRFVWFRDLAGLQRFLRTRVPPGAHRELSALCESLLTLSSLRERLNRLCRGGLRLVWLGHFEELCEGQSSFARCIRAWLRQWTSEESCDILEEHEVVYLASLVSLYRLCGGSLSPLSLSAAL